MSKTRSPFRRVARRPARSTLRTLWRAPDDLRESIVAFRRAIRCHRRLIRLAPAFFDAAVVDRERQNHAARRQWMAMWEPALARAYGVPPAPLPPPELPPLPCLRTQRAVDRQLQELRLWMDAGALARHRHQCRRPHALPTLTQLARLLQIAHDFKSLALGWNSPNPLPDLITCEAGLKDFERAYGHRSEPLPPPPVPAVPPVESVPPAEPLASPVVAPVLPLPVAPPPRNDAWRRWARHQQRFRSPC